MEFNQSGEIKIEGKVEDASISLTLKLENMPLKNIDALSKEIDDMYSCLKFKFGLIKK